MFREQYKAEFEKIIPDPGRLGRLAGKMEAKTAKRAAHRRPAAVRYGIPAVSLAVIVAAVVLYPSVGGFGHIVPQSLAPAKAGVSSGQGAGSGDYAALFGKISAGQPAEAAKGSAETAGSTFQPAGNVRPPAGGLAAQPPNVTDPNLLAAGVKHADFITADGGYIYALAQNTDGTVEVTVVAAKGSKSTVAARIECGGTLQKYAAFAAAAGPGSGIMVAAGLEVGAESKPYHPAAMLAGSGRLSVIVGYANAAVTIVYDVSDPGTPALLKSFAQSGAYSGSRMAEGILYLATSYTVASGNISRADPKTFVPQTSADGAAGLIPMQDIYAGAGSAGTYMVVTAVQLAGTPVQLYAKALFGSVGTVYAGAQSILLASPVQQTVQQYTNYSEWYDVPQSKQTAKTGRRVRYAWTTTLTTYNQELKLFSIGGTAVTLTAGGTVPGAIAAVSGTPIDESGGYFRLVTDSYEDMSGSGRYQNENGEDIEYNNPSGIPSPPKPPMAGQNNALYVLDGNLKQVGSLTGLTSEWVNDVQFSGGTCTIKTDNQTISVDLSDPDAPKIR